MGFKMYVDKRSASTLIVWLSGRHAYALRRFSLLVQPSEFLKAHTHTKQQENKDDAAGVILHPSSLPGPYGIGEIGEEAFRFVDWLESAGAQVR